MREGGCVAGTGAHFTVATTPPPSPPPRRQRARVDRRRREHRAPEQLLQVYSSHLTKWKSQRRAGALSALAARRRGPKAEPPNPLAKRNAELERENRRLQRRLAHAEAINEIPKGVSELLRSSLDRPESDGRTS